MKKDTRFKSGDQHPRAVNLQERLQKIRNMDLGTLNIVGDQITRSDSQQKILTHCSECGVTREIDVHNILSGKTKNCRCQRRLKYRTENEKILAERYDAILQRCENPANASYKNYGDRGIECRIEREEFISYILSIHRGTLRGWDIDRIDNDGHYEKRNLRVVRRSENLLNREGTYKIMYEGEEIPAADLYYYLKEDYPEFRLTPNYTAKLAREGILVEEILRRGGVG